MEQLNSIGQKALNELNRWPNWLLLAVGLLIMGYVLRNVRRVSNESIPGWLVVSGALTNAILAGGDPHEQGWAVWTMRQMLIGAIVGWVVWRVHHHVLKPLEDKFPWLRFLIPSDETSFFIRGRSNVPKPPAVGPTVDK